MNLSSEEREAVDLSAAWEMNEAIVDACEAEDLAALREALRSYERETLAALDRTRERSGAA
jgi:DNA-binding GntR family transcriptional regulator